MRQLISFAIPLCGLILASAAHAEEVQIMPINFSLAPQGQASPTGESPRPAGDGEQARTSETPRSAPGATLDVSASVEDRALFLDQGFTATTRPTAVFVAAVSSDGWTGELFRRQALTRYSCDSETDLAVIRTETVGSVTVTAKVAYISICGPDAIDLRLSASQGLGNGFTATVTGEIIRETSDGGFNDDVVKLNLGYERDLGGDWKLSANAQVAYSSFSGGVSLAGSAELSRPVFRDWTIAGYAQAYNGPLGADRGFGLRLGRSFTFGR
jgi:hypothetical protein